MYKVLFSFLKVLALRLASNSPLAILLLQFFSLQQLFFSHSFSPFTNPFPSSPILFPSAILFPCKSFPYPKSLLHQKAKSKSKSLPHQKAKKQKPHVFLQ
jgi:hypothetical protein